MLFIFYYSVSICCLFWLLFCLQRYKLIREHRLVFFVHNLLFSYKIVKIGKNINIRPELINRGYNASQCGCMVY